MGTVHLLDAVRAAPDVRAVVCVTSDKCYENRAVGDATPRRSRLAGELAGAGFREDARLGGDDPYASSKAAAELAVEAYRRSFFAGSVAGGADAPRVASARAGNVIGGGDWGKDRLVPDLMRAALSGQPVRVRNPDAVRPWQHVLNPLSGYLVLAQALWEDPRCARAWNFGPPPRDAWPVRRVVERVSELWPGGLRWRIDERPNPPEADRLQLDSSRARERLGWRPPLDLEQALEATVEWHLQLPGGADAREATRSQIGRYVRAAGVLEESRSL
jgi:CDP-glucose 4,6-dehydratase